MKNPGFLLLSLFFSISSFTLSIAQPRLTVWRVAADHHENHALAAGTDEKIAYECGAYYYMTHTGEQVDMHIALKNDGSEVLHLDLPIKMSVLSSPYLAVTSGASTGTLAPGEETMITISYLNTSSYVPGQRGTITFSSNDFINPLCGFSIEVGDAQPETYCVCEEGELLTIENLIKGAPGDESGVLLPIQPNQFRLHPGSCNEELDECPAEESLSCYYTNFMPNFRTAIAGNQPGIMAPSAAPFYLEIAPGYCPCIIETDFCVRPEEIAPPMLVEDGCIGHPETFEVFNCWEMDSALDHGDLTLPEEYTYQWCTDGVGTFIDNTGKNATIEGWFTTDYIFVKVTNEEGCIGVGWQELPYAPNMVPLQLQNEPPTCIQDDLVLCLDVASTQALQRNKISTRSENIEWFTNGEGVFSNPMFMEGKHCITISGMKFGDKVYAIDHSSHGTANVLPFDCPVYGVYNSTFLGPPACTEALENVGLGGISLDDPCNCADPLNLPFSGPGYSQLFHDILTIQNLLPGEPVEIIPGSNFFNENGMAFPGPIIVIADMWGRVEFDFWHPPDIPAMATINPEVSEMASFTSSVCEACIPIPTLSQWGIIILSLFIFIIGLVFMRQTGSEKILF